MKVYKNSTGIKSLFPQILATGFVVLLIINIINAVKFKDFTNIKYYVMILILFIYVKIILIVNYYRKIYLDEKNIYLERILFRNKIPYYEILEIQKPNIITLKNIITLTPKGENFWEEIDANYLRYYNNNKEYFEDTKEIYVNLLEIKYELNGIENNEKIRPQQSMLVIIFIWLIYLRKYFMEKKLWKEYIETKKILNRYINENKSKPNFA
jgi:hypothetical protein